MVRNIINASVVGGAIHTRMASPFLPSVTRQRISAALLAECWVFGHRSSVGGNLESSK
jgi:hypothetical protein